VGAPSQPRPAAVGRPHGNRRWPWIFLILLLLAVGAGAAYALVSLTGDSGNKGKATTTNKILPIVSVKDFDPAGDGSEHSSEVQRAIDSDPSTFWQTDGLAPDHFGHRGDVRERMERADLRRRPTRQLAGGVGIGSRFG
jgi:hypothetical protein